MSLTHILGFTIFALALGLVRNEAWRGWLLMIASIVAVFWLQPSTPIRHLDFWLPTASLGLSTLVWAATLPTTGIERKETLAAGAVLGGLILAIGLTRYIGPLCCLLPSRPPGIPVIALVVGSVAIISASSARLAGRLSLPIAFLGFLLVGLLVLLKTPSLARSISAALRLWAEQSTALASPFDIRWLGFSYLAFRLIHVLRDRAAGRLPATSLREFITYALFFPAYTAGPIERLPNFVAGLRPPPLLTAVSAISGGERLMAGILKKFVIADSLAILALNETNAAQVASPFWVWVLLYAYAFRIFFDFSGYTDIAIGLSQLLGIRLPENFDRPYLRPNLTAFWNSWHITLALWFRAYFFNPLTRLLRGRALPTLTVIFLAQMSTMLLIGLWHGVSLNFAAWGAWHGLGLFIHNRWSTWGRGRFTFLETSPRLQGVANAAGIMLTFHYVVLGWVWFALPGPGLSWNVLRKLFGA